MRCVTNMLSFSIITPSFNQGSYISRTINSVLEQNYSDLEYLVVDGNSTDNTHNVLRSYSDKLVKRIIEPDDGQADAVNKGIMATSGEIIGWLNSDDVYYSDTFKMVSEYFMKYPGIDVVYGMAHHIDQDDSILNQYPTEPWNFSRLARSCFICQPAAFFRRSIVRKYGYLNKQLSYCMDYEYWLRAALGGAQFGYLEEFLAGSRLHRQAKTISRPIKMRWEANKVVRESLGRVHIRWKISLCWAVVRHVVSRCCNLFKSLLFLKVRKS